MNETDKRPFKQDTLIFKVCHKCSFVNESTQEPERCQRCAKAFLPLNYFEKIHGKKDPAQGFTELFETSDNLDERDLIKGLYVLW